MSMLLLFRPSTGGGPVFVADSDTGSGAEAQTIVVTWNLSDSSAGIDSQTLLAILVGSETASGADSGLLAAALTQAETAAGTEGSPGTSVTIGSGDTGTGGDGGLLNTGTEYRADQDISYSEDAVTNRTFQFDDAATGTDDQTVVFLVRLLSDSDSAQGYDLQIVRSGKRPTLLSTGLSGIGSEGPGLAATLG